MSRSVSDVSVVTVNWNGKEHLETLLPSLSALGAAEIIVVDNGSIDGSQDFVRTRYPAVRIIQNDVNRGFAQPNNLAAEVARGRFLALVNNDMRVDANWLGAALARLGNSIASVGSRILDWQGEEIDFNGSSLQYLGYALQQDAGKKKEEAASPDRILFPCGGAMVVDREIFRRVGGFDERLQLGPRLVQLAPGGLAAPGGFLRLALKFGAGGALLLESGPGFFQFSQSFPVGFGLPGGLLQLKLVLLSPGELPFHFRPARLDPLDLFTRLADLSETAVVMPRNPSPEQIGLYLEMLGWFAAQTGYPALRVTVTDPARLAGVQRKDLLIIGTAENQPLFGQWAREMPVRADAGRPRLATNGRFELPWTRAARERRRLAEMLEAESVPEAIIEQFESPLQPGRCVVAIATAHPRRIEPLAALLAGSADLAHVYGSVSVLKNGRFHGFLAPAQGYHLGRLRQRHLRPLDLG